MKWHIDYTDGRAFTGLICIMSVTFYFKPPCFLPDIDLSKASRDQRGGESKARRMSVCTHVGFGGGGMWRVRG